MATHTPGDFIQVNLKCHSKIVGFVSCEHAHHCIVRKVKIRMLNSELQHDLSEKQRSELCSAFGISLQSAWLWIVWLAQPSTSTLLVLFPV